MGLGKRKTGGGEPLPKLVWDSKASQIYTEVRTNNGREWWSERTPIELGEFRGTPDLPNVEVGWIAYLKGIGLDAKLVRMRGGEDYGGCPSGGRTGWSRGRRATRYSAGRSNRARARVGATERPPTSRT